MPTALIATPDPEDYICRETEEQLQRRGFSVEVVAPIAAIPDKVEMICQLGLSVDVILCLARVSTLFTPIQVGDSYDLHLEVLGVVRRLRALSEELCFRGLIRACTVPVVVVRGGHSYLPIPGFRWLTVKTLRFDTPYRLPSVEIMSAVEDGIRAWRRDVLNELDHVGFAVTPDHCGRLRVSDVLVRKRKEGEILCPRATPGSLRSSNLYLVSSDSIQEAQKYFELEFLLNGYREIAAAEHVKPETVFQRFFDENPQMLYRGSYGRHWSKPNLPIPGSTERYQPDYVLAPLVGPEFGFNWEVTDLKLPEQPLLLRTRTHQDLPADMVKGLMQLKDYQTYFNRDDVRSELRQRFGSVPRNPKAALIVGRTPGIDDALRFSEALGKFQLNVSVVTYDDILDFQARKFLLELEISKM
jgi:hypothetical protein